MGVPESVINICSGVLLSNDYKHTIWFDDGASQNAYFAGKVVKTFSAYSYLRKTWSIRVEATMEQAHGWNYLYFRNTPNGKFYYYFITSVEYIGEYCVELSLELDVMQTYLHEYTLHPSFVEREHSASDEIGENITDEGLELGEFVVNNAEDVEQMKRLGTCVMTSVDLSEEDLPISSCSLFNGVTSALDVFMFTHSNLTLLLRQLDSVGKSDAIVAIWMYPENLLEKTAISQGYMIYDIDGYQVTKAGKLDYDIKLNTSLDGYTPRNKKLLTHPFNFLYVTNNAGGCAIYPYEYFANASEGCDFRITGAVSPEGATRIHPRLYKGCDDAYDEGLAGSPYPSCAWNQDVYKLWLAQNQHQNTLKDVSNLGQIGVGLGVAVGGAFSMNPMLIASGAGMAINGGMSVAQTLAQRKDAQVQPPQAKGAHSGSVNIANDKQTFTLMQKSIDAYHARIIDGYFDMYGYKTSRVKIPNRNVRELYCYTKTIGCTISGNLCADDLNKIRSIYDNGITFWKNGDLIGWYTASNKCVGGE